MIVKEISINPHTLKSRCGDLISGKKIGCVSVTLPQFGSGFKVSDDECLSSLTNQPLPPNFRSRVSDTAQVSMHSRHWTHSRLRIFSGMGAISTGQSASQRWQDVQRSWSMMIRSGAILLETANSAPKGHRYLHQKRWTNIEVITKVIKTLHSNGVVKWKPKSARAGQKAHNGGETVIVLAIKTPNRTRYFK